ncbi:hypothetical protein GCM10020001_052370 [Nonomuraea salmonea]
MTGRGTGVVVGGACDGVWAVVGGFGEGAEMVQVDGLAVAVEGEHDGQAQAHLGGGDDDDEEGEHLAAVQAVAQPYIERDQVEVDGVEHQLDRHQDEDRVASCEHAVDADGEQERGDDRRVDDVHY